MKKLIVKELALILLLIGVMATLLYQKEPRLNITEAEVDTAFSSVVGDASVSKAGYLRIRRVFGLNASDYDLFVYYTPVETMDVCEFLLVRVDEKQIQEVQKALEERISSQLTAFTNYGEHQTELLEHAIIKQYGNYLCLIVSEVPQIWLDAVEELLEV